MKLFSQSVRRSLIIVAGVLLLIALYVGGMAALKRSTMINFEVVENGRLLRTAQPRTGDLDRILRDEGIGTILSLRGGEEPGVKDWAQKHGVLYLSIQMWADVPPTPGQVGIFFDIMRGDPVYFDNYQDVIEHRTLMKRTKTYTYPFPVLLHCQGGSDRTGVMVALYRMAFQGWGVKLAEQDMSGRLHFTSLHPAQFEFLERIAPSINRWYGSRSPRAPGASGAVPAQPAVYPPPAAPAPPPAAPTGAP